MRIEKLKTEHHVKVEWVHFPLHPDTPDKGRSLADLFAERNVDRKAMHAQMKARMDAEGLPYGERTMTYNSRLAQELGKWADTQPGGEAIHDALFRAYFVEARDISRPDVLLEIAKQVGLPPDAAREVLEKRTFKAAVDADWKLSREYGVTGVPTFVAGQQGVVGAQPYEVLEQLVKKAAEQASASPMDIWTCCADSKRRRHDRARDDADLLGLRLTLVLSQYGSY